MKYILAIALGLISATANAKLVSFDFSGVFHAPSRTVLQGGSTSEPIFLGLIKDGDNFSGQFTYDTDAKSISGFGGSQTFELYSFNIQASSGFNSRFSAWPDRELIVNHSPDSFYAIGENRAVEGTNRWISVSVGAKVPLDTFNRRGLPDSLGSFSNSTLDIAMFHDPDWRVQDFVSGDVHIQPAAVSPVPEPSTALMLLAALGGIGGMAALRRRG